MDPNMLLKNFRNAMALDHRAIALLAAAQLDQQLSADGELPDDWKGAHHGP
jgi:hypothetical protein